MYRCQLCQKVAPAGTRPTKMVVETRAKEYEARGRAPRESRGPSRFREPPGPYDRGGAGRETVKELTLCPDCAKRVAEEQAAQAPAPPPRAEKPAEEVSSAPA
jgi:hypothetical protein